MVFDSTLNTAKATLKLHFRAPESKMLLIYPLSENYYLTCCQAYLSSVIIMTSIHVSSFQLGECQLARFSQVVAVVASWIQVFWA